MRGSGENRKHRTEVTEVAEGGSDWLANFLAAGSPRLEREGHAKTESIAQRSHRGIGRRRRTAKAMILMYVGSIDSTTFGVSGISTSTTSARALSNE